MGNEIVMQAGESGGLGALRLAGFVRNSRGDDQGTGRRLGRYALVYSLRGECEYWDEVNGSKVVGPGELFFLFPEIAHRYGAKRGGSGWDEFYVVFEGPVFDLWRRVGLLDPRRSFLSLEPVSYWTKRLQSCLAAPGLDGDRASLMRVVRLQEVLWEALSADEWRTDEPPWLREACSRLADPEERRVGLKGMARHLGVSFETFRKGFRAVTGKPPARYRAEKLVEEAARLLARGQWSSKEIAERLGFADEFHFSKRFKQVVGVPPREFRRRMAGEKTLSEK